MIELEEIKNPDTDIIQEYLEEAEEWHHIFRGDIYAIEKRIEELGEMVYKDIKKRKVFNIGLSAILLTGIIYTIIKEKIK